jgi:hypothetical protein
VQREQNTCLLRASNVRVYTAPAQPASCSIVTPPTHSIELKLNL